MARDKPVRKDAEELVNSITHGVGVRAENCRFRGVADAGCDARQRGAQASHGARSGGSDGTRNAGATVAPVVSRLAPVNLRHV